MTPLIDVVFIMLLFFMLVTNYQRWQTVSIDAVALPGSSVALAPTPAVLALSPVAWTLDGEAITRAALLDALRQRVAGAPALQVQVLVDSAVPIQALVGALDVLREAGVTQTRLGAWAP